MVVSKVAVHNLTVNEVVFPIICAYIPELVNTNTGDFDITNLADAMNNATDIVGKNVLCGFHCYDSPLANPNLSSFPAVTIEDSVVRLSVLKSNTTDISLELRVSFGSRRSVLMYSRTGWGLKKGVTTGYSALLIGKDNLLYEYNYMSVFSRYGTNPVTPTNDNPNPCSVSSIGGAPSSPYVISGSGNTDPIKIRVFSTVPLTPESIGLDIGGIEPKKYPITYIPINSTLSGPESAASGDTVSVDVTYPDGYIYQERGISVYNTDGAIAHSYDPTTGKLTFTMP